MLHELLIALSLVLVIEGVLPFLSPGTVRRMMISTLEADDRSLRIAGFVSMMAGVMLLYLVN